MITYNAPNNKIIVVGYSLVTPANFTDIYNADKAGTLSLHARTGISSTDGAGVATDRAERPADYIVLGGASNDLYITIANWNGTTATIRITGTDRDGAAQTEDIVVTANGNYSTTKWFKTITHTQVTAFTATSFDYDLTQGQWGVVWKNYQDIYEGTFFYCDARLHIGDGSTATYFKDTDKVFKIRAGYDIGCRAESHTQFGELIDATNKSSKDGCAIYSPMTGNGNADLKIYSSYIFGKILDFTSPRFWNIDGKAYYNNIVTGDFFRVSGYNDSLFIGVTGDFDDIYGRNGGSQGLIFFNNPLSDSKIYNLKAVDNQYLFYSSGLANTNFVLYLVNPDVDAWDFYWAVMLPFWPNNYQCHEIYEFDLKVTDKDGNDINGATVKVWDKDDSLVVDTTTASGVIATQEVLRAIYQSATPSSSTTSTTKTDKSLHTIQISKAGYQTYSKKFTLYKKIDWVIRLKEAKKLQLDVDGEVYKVLKPEIGTESKIIQV